MRSAPERGTLRGRTVGAVWVACAPIRARSGRRAHVGEEDALDGQRASQGADDAIGPAGDASRAGPEQLVLLLTDLDGLDLLAAGRRGQNHPAVVELVEELDHLGARGVGLVAPAEVVVDQDGARCLQARGVSQEGVEGRAVLDQDAVEPSRREQTKLMLALLQPEHAGHDDDLVLVADGALMLCRVAPDQNEGQHPAVVERALETGRTVHVDLTLH